MHFPALLTALFIDRVFWNASDRRNFDWLRDYVAWWLRRSWIRPARNAHWVGLVPVLPLLLLIAWLQTGLAPAIGSLVEFAFATLVLLFSLGPRDLGQDVEQFLSAMSKGDNAEAGKLADTISTEPADSTESATERVRDGLLIAICHRYIGPVFWFAILGPVGAAAYRLAEQVRRLLDSQPSIGSSNDRLFPLLNWIPVRLTAAGFAIAGNFDAVAAAWKHCSQNESECPRDSDLLLATGRAALENHHAHGSAEGIEDAMALGWRNLTLWVAIVGVASLLSIL
jgi:membrane protein required for beta-lactamase induction